MFLNIKKNMIYLNLKQKTTSLLEVDNYYFSSILYKVEDYEEEQLTDLANLVSA